MPVGEQLRQALVAKAGRVIDLFREWDTDGDGAPAREHAPHLPSTLTFTHTTRSTILYPPPSP